jgi:DNA-binding SARP family transcriptional activator
VIVTTSRGYELHLGANQLDYLLFRRWLAESRDLRQAAAVLECAELACALGQATHMIGPLREINSWDPFNGAAQAQLIRTLIAAGERAAAVRAFNQIQALLADELGVDPDQPVVEAYLHALNGSAKGAGG